MAYFIKEKLSDLATARGARALLAARAQRVATDNVYLLERIVKDALPLVREEAREFADRLDEPLPGHVQRALDAEISMWERLEEGLANLQDATPTSTELDRYARRVRSYLSWHHDLILLEQDMITNCLVRHYDQQREAILARAATYDITRIY
jgi:hypothetical protein